MQQLAVRTDPPAAQRWSLWIDRLHRHRLVQVLDNNDAERIRLQPIPESSERPPSYLESASRLLGPDYEPLTPRR
jgi:hypothetical protein